MASHTRVLVLSDSGEVLRTIKRSQARNRVAQCLSAWVVEDYSVLDLTLAETVKARSERARMEEPLALAELRETRFVPPPGALSVHRQRRHLIRIANSMACPALTFSAMKEREPRGRKRVAAECAL